jgi:hypothetical protein
LPQGGGEGIGVEAHAVLEEGHDQVDAEGAAELAHEVGNAGALAHPVGRQRLQRRGVEAGLTQPRPSRETITMPTAT